MASAILTAWREEEGDLLAFLPGVAEIECNPRARSAIMRVAERINTT